MIIINLNMNSYMILKKNIANNELINYTVSGKNMDLYDLIKKLKIARERGFLFIRINKLTKKFIHISDI